MATMEVITTQIIASIVEDLVSRTCGENNTTSKKNKGVRFAEDMQVYYYDRLQGPTNMTQGEDCLTKTYDGMEFAKQVTEYLVYACFEKRIITSGRTINPILNVKFGNLDKVVTDRVVELLTNAHERVQQLPIYSKSPGKAQLFQDTSGKYGLAFRKAHQDALKILIKLCKLSFQKNTSAN